MQPANSTSLVVRPGRSHGAGLYLDRMQTASHDVELVGPARAWKLHGDALMRLGSLAALGAAGGNMEMAGHHACATLVHAGISRFVVQ